MQWGPSSPRKVTWSSPNAHGPHLCHTIFFPPTCTYETTGRLLWSVDRKIKLEPGLQMVNLHDMQAPPENEQLQHYSPFLGHTWRSVVNRKFPSGQNFKQCSWLLFFLGSRHGEMCDYILMYRLGPMAFLDGQGLWINMIEKLVTRNLGKNSENWPLLLGKNTRIFMSHVNAHQRVTLAKMYFNNQVDRFIHSVNTSQPIFPITTVTAQWAYEQSGHGDKDGGYVGLNNMDFNSPRSTWL